MWFQLPRNLKKKLLSVPVRSKGQYPRAKKGTVTLKPKNIASKFGVKALLRRRGFRLSVDIIFRVGICVDRSLSESQVSDGNCFLEDGEVVWGKFCNVDSHLTTFN